MLTLGWVNPVQKDGVILFLVVPDIGRWGETALWAQ